MARYGVVSQLLDLVYKRNSSTLWDLNLNEPLYLDHCSQMLCAMPALAAKAHPLWPSSNNLQASHYAYSKRCNQSKQGIKTVSVQPVQVNPSPQLIG